MIQPNFSMNKEGIRAAPTFTDEHQGQFEALEIQLPRITQLTEKQKGCIFWEM
jgi:hypothetical protein